MLLPYLVNDPTMNRVIGTLAGCCAVAVLGGWSGDTAHASAASIGLTGSHAHHVTHHSSAVSNTADSVIKWDSTGWSGRIVVGEYMTGIGCPLCQAHEYAFDSLMKRYPRTVFIPLAYHFGDNVPISNPKDSILKRMWGWYDFWSHLADDSTLRKAGHFPAIFSDTGINGEPNWDDWIDGHSVPGKLVDQIDAELHKAPEAVLHLEATPHGGKIVAKVQVESLSGSHQDVYVRMAVVEDTVNLVVTDTSKLPDYRRPGGEYAYRLNHYMVVRSAARDPKNPSKYTMGIPLHGSGTVTYTFDMAKTQEQRLHFRALQMGTVKPKSEWDNEFVRWMADNRDQYSGFGGMEGWTMDPKRLYLVAFVQDAHTGDVLQTQMVHVNTGLQGELLKLPK